MNIKTDPRPKKKKKKAKTNKKKKVKFKKVNFWNNNYLEQNLIMIQRIQKSSSPVGCMAAVEYTDRISSEG